MPLRPQTGAGACLQDNQSYLSHVFKSGILTLPRIPGWKHTFLVSFFQSVYALPLCWSLTKQATNWLQRHWIRAVCQQHVVWCALVCHVVVWLMIPRLLLKTVQRNVADVMFEKCNFWLFMVIIHYCLSKWAVHRCLYEMTYNTIGKLFQSRIKKWLARVVEHLWQ